MCSGREVGVAERLADINAWVKRYHSEALGAWVFFTDCKIRSALFERNGVAGGAFPARVCHKELRVALVTYDPSVEHLKLAFIHELGHLLGAIHTFDHPHNLAIGGGHGIMDYDDPARRDQELQFHAVHHAEMCFTISHSRRCTGADLSTCEEHGLLLDRECWALVECPHACDQALLGNGVCNEQCDFVGCNHDNGDCTTGGPTCAPQRQGDGVCDEECNTEECNFDGGDCDCKDVNDDADCREKVWNGMCEMSDLTRLYQCQESCYACDTPRPPLFMINTERRSPSILAYLIVRSPQSGDFLQPNSPVIATTDCSDANDDLIHGIFCQQYEKIDPGCKNLPNDVAQWCTKTCSPCVWDFGSEVANGSSSPRWSSVSNSLDAEESRHGIF